MAMLVDTNVILDVAFDDPVWADWSEARLAESQPDGLFINPVIYAELCAGAETLEEVEQILGAMKLGMLEVSRPGLFLAAKAFLRYRQSGGTKASPLADFFMGGQAEALGWAILTRDSTRYRNYFPNVRLVTPET